jgi:signal transduction histidine kinase
MNVATSLDLPMPMPFESPREDDADRSARLARRAANHRIAFIAHYIVFSMTIALVWLAGGFMPAVFTGLAWGIGLACHGFFGVVAPILRQRWTRSVTQKLNASTSIERRSIEGRHARSLEELSASIAHEIRNPITAAKSLVAQMGEDPSSPENVEYARVALEELDRVERSIAHLLRFARDEEVQMSDTRMIDVVDSALESFRDRFARSGVTVTREIDSDGAIRGDAEKLRRVVINLVQNALDALEESAAPSPSIALAAGENLARTEVWLRVRDNGPGIPEARLERIFKPFFTSKESGTGLGLAISRKIVEAHGGTLEARSPRAGSGTELTMVLPKAGR